jgi:hypothetical protein
MIEPASDLLEYKVSGASIHTIEIAETDLNKCAVFVRYTPQGIVLVRSYFEERETMVQTISNGRQYSRWYKHGLITSRAASRLVSRFLGDIDDHRSAEVD